MDIRSLAQMERVHAGLDDGAVTELLFGELAVAGEPFLPLYRRCMAETGTISEAWKVFRRVQRAYNLSRCLVQTRHLDAPRVECGVFAGFSGLLACEVLRAGDQDYCGEDLYLVDSYEGLSMPVAEDHIELYDSEGRVVAKPSHESGHFAVDLERVMSAFDDYPDVQFVKGWIPEVFSVLPDTQWSFVHVDVDLYEPTMACLEYFVPRMVSGGIVLNDDFASPLFPGGGSSWSRFFEVHQLPYAILDTGQALFIKP